MKLTILGSGTSVPHPERASPSHFLETPNGLKDEDSKLFVYTSDTGFSEDLGPFAKHAALLLMECSFRRNKPVQKHLELADAMRLAHECAPEKLVLTHLYQEWDNFDLAADARSLWSGETVEAKDGLQLEI